MVRARSALGGRVTEFMESDSWLDVEMNKSEVKAVECGEGDT